VYIPILPSPLLEVLNTPTPFIAGVSSIHKEELKDLVSSGKSVTFGFMFK